MPQTQTNLSVEYQYNPYKKVAIQKKFWANLQ